MLPNSLPLANPPPSRVQVYPATFFRGRGRIKQPKALVVSLCSNVSFAVLCDAYTVRTVSRPDRVIARNEDTESRSITSRDDVKSETIQLTV